MNLSYQPNFSLSVNDNDISYIIKKHLISLTLTDNSGDESDVLNISLILPPEIKTPSKGAALKLSLGFNNHLVNKGVYIVDQISTSWPPRIVQITANAAPITESHYCMQSKKSRSWHDMTLSDILRTVAGEHALYPRISSSLKNIRIEHIDQTNESDMNMLTRIAKTYGAISKPANGCWLLIKDSDGKTVSGNQIDDINLNIDKLTNAQFTFNSRDIFNRVIATYFDVTDGEAKEISIGTKEPTYRFPYQFSNKEEAEAKAKTKINTSKNGNDTFDLSLPASIETMHLIPEGYINLSGFSDVENGRWKVKTIEWSLSSSGLQLRVSGDKGEVK